MKYGIAKKCLGWLAACALTLGAATEAWADTATVDGIIWTYTVSDGKATVTKGALNETGSVVVPRELGGYPVTGIGDDAFSNRGYGFSGLTNVTIPDSVTSIGNWAFAYCRDLKNVTILGNVTNDYWGDDYWGGGLPFEACTNLSTLVLGEKTTKIGAYMFYGCRGLANVTLPDSVTSIGQGAFANCGLTSLTIPENVTDIGASAFSGCSLTNVTILGNIPADLWWSNEGFRNSSPFYECGKLSTLVLGEKMTNIGGGMFCRCRSLKSVTILGNVTNDWNSNYPPFESCTNISTLVFGEKMTKIGACMFYDCSCSGLTNVTLPENVTSIGFDAFAGCSGLTSVTILGNITDCGGPGFSTTLSKVVLSEKMTEIANRLFAGCSGLRSVTIPTSVTSIGDYAFSGCSGLTNVTIPTSVTNIGDYAFSRCNGLTNVTIGNSVTSIGCSAFEYCPNLTSVTIPESVTSIGANAFGVDEDWQWGWAYSRLKTVTILGNVTNDWSGGWKNTPFYCSTNIETVVLGEKMTKIGNYMLSGLVKLRNVTIPGNVTSIGAGAFDGCSGLTSLTIPDGVTNIGSRMISGCSGVTSLMIPDSVTGIGEGAFSGSSLQTLSVPGAWEGTSKLWSAGVPSTCEVVYRAEPPEGEVRWKYSVNNGKATVTGAVPAEGDLEIPATLGGYPVASIGGLAFFECTNLVSVVIPNGVTNIEADAFGDSGLTSVTIPGSVTHIQTGAFEGCDGLTALVIPEGVEYIGTTAFGFCDGLRSISLPESVVQFGNGPFEGCGALLEITVAEGNGHYSSQDGVLYSKDGRTLVCCPGGKTGTFAIPDRVEDIESFAFFRCKGLASVEIPEGVREIGGYAFAHCTGLTELVLPKSVTGFLWEVFGGCTGLETLYVPSSWAGTEMLASASVPEGCTIVYYTVQRVTFKANGGECGTATKDYRSPGTYGELPAATRNGHAFLGWYTKASGGTKVTGQSSVTAAAKRTLYAHWTDRQATTFNGNGGTPDTQVRTNTIGQAYGEMPEAAREGQAFLGWFTKKTGGEQVTGTDLVTVAASRTLYAHWTDRQITTFNGNGGTPATQVRTNTVGAAYGALPTAARAGYAFQGWWTAADGGERVTEGSPVPAEAARTLWAHWTQDAAQTVWRFYAQTYKGHFFTISETEKANLIATSKTWAFQGGAYRAYKARVEGTVPLYRFYSEKYKGHFFTRSEAEKDGLVATSKTWKYQGIAFYVYPNAAEGSVPVYRFWSDAYGHHFYTASEAEKDSLVATSKTWKYQGIAFWALPLNATTVTFDAAGGTCGTETKTYVPGKAYGALPEASWNGHAFLGWFTAASGGTRVTAQSIVEGAQSRTLYAHWEAAAEPLKVWRFYSEKNKGHFFTISEAEKTQLLTTSPTWTFQGGAYRAYKTRVGGTVPLYRFYSERYKGHFFTRSEAEKDGLVATSKTWKFQGIAYYVYPEAADGRIPVYRFWSDAYGHHFYTASEAEKDSLVATSKTWKYQGIAFWALPNAAGRGAGSRTVRAEAKGSESDGMHPAAQERAENRASVPAEGFRLDAEVTTSDGTDGSAAADGDEGTAWVPEHPETGSWLVLTFDGPLEVAEVTVVGENLPEGTRVLMSEDAETWFEGEAGMAQYVWVAFPPVAEGLKVREVWVGEDVD